MANYFNTKWLVCHGCTIGVYIGTQDNIPVDFIKEHQRHKDNQDRKTKKITQEEMEELLKEGFDFYKDD